MYPSYYEFGYGMENAGLALAPVLVTRGVPSAMLSIAAYVLTALALYTIAKRRCINHPWLAWVPVANLWLLGSLSDQYRYVAKGQIKSKRKLLLILKAVSFFLTVSVLALVLTAGVKGFRMASYNIFADRILEELLPILLWIAGIALPLAVASIAFAVVYFMALYDVYSSCDPDNDVLFLVLSILFGNIAKPLLLLLSRQKDLGMPPRREEPVRQPEWEAPAQESWDNKDYL